jgi:hypothetical protein
MGDRKDIFIKILTVVGVMEWVCLALWLFFFLLFVIEPSAHLTTRRSRADDRPQAHPETSNENAADRHCLCDRNRFHVPSIRCGSA